MPPSYTLDTKIEALNLLDQHDGDFHLVNNRLGIPLKSLRGWRANQDELRRQFDDRQYRHFANLKLELLNDMFESCRDLMKKIKTGDHEGIAVSQLAYTFSTLLNHANQLEDFFEDLAPNPQNEIDQPNRIEFVYDDSLPPAPPGTESNPRQSRPLQGPGLRQALGQIGVGQNRHPHSRPSATQTLLVDRPNLPNGEPNLARPAKQRKTSRRRQHKRDRSPH